VARGDADAVAGHLRALDDHAPAQAPLYRGLARATADRLDDPAPEIWAVLAAGQQQMDISTERVRRA
jgi:predicted short-subunit dehydrogenase-like oxidoreductase (DUF2520 family)